MKREVSCPHCLKNFQIWDNPKPVVDIIIEMECGIVLIKRKNPPYGWAIPGGFVDYGESVEKAAAREAKEETGVIVDQLEILGVYSDPERDARVHTISTVFMARGSGILKADDDAAFAEVFDQNNLPTKLAFDHEKILNDYFSLKEFPCK